MDSMRLSTVIVVICAVSALCYPSKPLNERSPELAWQAWLLVDDQNQNGKQQNDDGGQTMRRRITPKSVFIAPTFSPESLPPCADGYASDPMGRCMKIFKVDEDAHLQFLLQKITDKFGNTYSNDYDYEDEDEATSTPGPFQLNIPLGGLETAASDESKVVAGDDDEMDMAIVVAPTNSNFNPQEAISKLDKQRRGGIQQTTDSQTQMPEKPEDKQEVNTEASFIDEIQTTTETTTTEIESTTSSTTMETTTDFTTVTPTTESTTSTTEIDLETTTITNLELEETRTELMDDYTSTTTESTTTTDLPVKETTTISQKFEKIKFPDSDPQLFDSPKGMIRFPDEPEPEAAPLHHTRDLSSQMRQFSNTDPWRDPAKYDNDVTQTQKVKFPSAHANWGPHSQPHNIQKPLVLRFSRKNSYVDPDQFKQPDFYRTLPLNELNYIFGFKNRHRPPNR